MWPLTFRYPTQAQGCDRFMSTGNFVDRAKGKKALGVLGASKIHTCCAKVRFPSGALVFGGLHDDRSISPPVSVSEASVQTVGRAWFGRRWTPKTIGRSTSLSARSTILPMSGRAVTPISIRSFRGLTSATICRALQNRKCRQSLKVGRRNCQPDDAWGLLSQFFALHE
jgi:hypothetical protein